MKVIWELAAPITVRDVYEALRERRQIAYTTVMTMMGILEQKGYLIKEPAERAHVYRPAEARQKVVRGMVRDFLNRVFDGSAKPLLMHLVEDDRLTPEEITEIAALARPAQKKRK